MHLEIQVALNFVVSHLYNKLPRRRVNLFGEELEKGLKLKFQNHWYPDKPMKGSAYRCLKTGQPTDAVLERAAVEANLNIADILENLPAEMSVWIDPGEVSYRIGEKGQMKVLWSQNGDSQDEANADREVTKTFNPEAQIFQPIETSRKSVSPYGSRGGRMDRMDRMVGGSPDGSPLSNGLANGLSNGMSNGMSNGLANGMSNGMSNGLANGMSNGLSNGMSNGLSNGLPNGLPNGLSNGFGVPVTTNVGTMGNNMPPPVSAPAPVAVVGSGQSPPGFFPPSLGTGAHTQLMTTAAFAQTKFGSTKLKTNAKRTHRMSPTEFSNYIKQRALQQQKQQQQQQQQQAAAVAGQFMAGMPRPRSLSPQDFGPFGGYHAGGPVVEKYSPFDTIWGGHNGAGHHNGMTSPTNNGAMGNLGTTAHHGAQAFGNSSQGFDTNKQLLEGLSLGLNAVPYQGQYQHLLVAN